MTQNKPSAYFAEAPREQIGQKLIERIDRYDKNSLVTQVGDRLFNAWRSYYGFDEEGFHLGSQVGRGGEQGELTIVRINHARALVNALLNLIIAPKFVWTPRAANIDYDSVRQTQLAADFLEHLWHNKKVAANAAKAVEEGIAFTEGFILVEWDAAAGSIFAPTPDGEGVVRTGDLRYTNVSSWDVIRDPNKPAWDELDWLIVRVWRNKYDLAARSKDEAERARILNAPNELPANTKHKKQDPDTDDVPVYIFFHKPCAVLPFGREVRFLADGTVIHFGNLPLDHIPLHRVVPSELIGTPFGYSAYLEILGVQELSDSINSSVASNISTFGTQAIAIEEGSNIDLQSLAGMTAVYYPPGKQPPAALQLTKSPPEAFKYLELLKSWQELLMGLNSVVRGEAQSDRFSGQALALLQSQALQQASTLQSNYVRMLEGVGTTSIQFLRKFASAPLKIGIVGQHKLAVVKESEVTKDKLSSVEQVYVELGNPISQTAAGRFELGQLLVQMKMVRTPEMLQQVFDTGRIDPLTRSSQEELLNILKENEDIAKGEVPVAMLHDQHLLHGKEHTTPVANPAARQDAAVLNAYMKHQLGHYELLFGVPAGEWIPDPITGEEKFQPTDPIYRERMLILTGQQPPPPMGPPGMGPPPPGMEPPPPGPMPNAADALETIAPPPGGTGAAPNVPKLPGPPENPATGQKWDPTTGGGVVPS